MVLAQDLQAIAGDGLLRSQFGLGGDLHPGESLSGGSSIGLETLVQRDSDESGGGLVVQDELLAPFISFEGDGRGSIPGFDKAGIFPEGEYGPGISPGGAPVSRAAPAGFQNPGNGLIAFGRLRVAVDEGEESAGLDRVGAHEMSTAGSLFCLQGEDFPGLCGCVFYP